jgi:hypothetical protein
VKVQRSRYPIAEHLLGESQGAGPARTGIEDRLAGKAAPANCA